MRSWCLLIAARFIPSANFGKIFPGNWQVKMDFRERREKAIAEVQEICYNRISGDDDTK